MSILRLALSTVTMLLLAAHTPSVEIENATVLRVLNGDTIVIKGSMAGVEVPIGVRLMFVNVPRDQPEEPGVQSPEEALRSLVPLGSSVRLSAPGDRFPISDEGMMLALVQLVGMTGNVNSAMILNGYSVFRDDHALLEQEERSEYLGFQTISKLNNCGMWKYRRDWMESELEKTNQNSSEYNEDEEWLLWAIQSEMAAGGGRSLEEVAREVLERHDREAELGAIMEKLKPVDP